MGYTRSDHLKDQCKIILNGIYESIDTMYTLQSNVNKFIDLGINMSLTNNYTKNDEILFLTVHKKNDIYNIADIMSYINKIRTNELYNMINIDFMEYRDISESENAILYRDKVIHKASRTDIGHFLHYNYIELDGREIINEKTKYPDPYYTIRLRNCINSYIIYSHTIDTTEDHPVCVNFKFYKDLNRHLEWLLKELDNYKLQPKEDDL